MIKIEPKQSSSSIKNPPCNGNKTNRYDTKFYPNLKYTVWNVVSVTCLPPITRQSNLYREHERTKNRWADFAIRFVIKHSLGNSHITEAPVIHRDESITHAPRQIFMLIRYAMERDRTTWFSYDRGKERGIITRGIKRRRKGGRRGGRGPNDGTVINHAGQQSNVCKYNQTM